MPSDPVSFNGGTRYEVISVLANCGRDTDRARRALVTWIRHKQDKSRSTEHILAKLRDIESKFIKDASLHSAFRDARAETFLPRAPDLPLPSFIQRRSQEHVLDRPASPSIAPPRYASSLSPELPMNSTQRISPPISPLRLSRDSSQMSENSSKQPDSRRPHSAPHAPPEFQPPRIQIPHHKLSHPASGSPITSSPEDSGFHLRYLRLSHPTRPSHSPSRLSPPSALPPEFSPSPTFTRSRNSDHGSSRGLVPPFPVPSIEIPPHRSRRSFPHSTSSEDSNPRSPHQLSGSMSPGRRRATPPRTSPPDAPLPPIPSDERDFKLNDDTPARPRPTQPIPSPVPSSEELMYSETINGNSSRHQWREPDGELSPSDDIVRQDSPVYEFNEDYASPSSGIGAPPPYVDLPEACSTSDMPTLGEELEKAVNVCGGSSEVRLEVSRCIGFCRGYEPPYWQTRLQACGLNAEAAKYLVDEMSKHVDWAASFGRAI